MASSIIGPDIMKLPAVLYFHKGDKKHGISKKGDKKHGITKHKKHKSKHTDKAMEKRDNIDGGRRDVVFLSRPADYSPTKSADSSQLPTTSYNLFNYQSNYRHWNFIFPEEHPVHMQYVDQGKAADPNQQNGAQQQATANQDATAAAATAPAVGAPAAASPAAPASAASAAPAVVPSTSAAAPAVASADPAAAPTEAQPASPVVAAPAVAAANLAVPQVQQAAAAAVQQPAAPVAAQQPVAAQPEAAANETIQLINQTVSLAANNTFEPTVANASQPNQIMVGALTAANNTSNQTAAPGNVAFNS